MESKLIEHKSLAYIIDECKKRGVACKILFINVLELEYGGRKEILYDILSPKTSATAYCICKSKDTAKYFLKKAGLSTPNGISFDRSKEDHALDYIRKENFNCVMKPNDGLGGDLVFTDIDSISDFKNAWKEILSKYERVLIEKKVAGDEYRFLATKNKTLSITKRVPAYIIGNGKNSIRQLIDIKNDRAISEGRKNISPDNPMANHLAKQGLTLDSIIENKKTVYLRQNTNTSTGGESISFAKYINSSLADVAVKAVNAIPGLEWAGVDIMTENIDGSENYNIIEINASPGINIHQNPTVGEKVNVASDILETIFPELKKKF